MISLGTSDFVGILPQIILALFGIYLMAQGVFAPGISRKTVGYLGLVGIGAAIIGNFFLIGQDYSAFGEMIRVDRLAVVLNFIFLVTAGLCLLMSTSYSDLVHIEFIEYTPLILFSTIGMMLMGSAGHLMIIFLGLETMSIALYVLAGFRRNNQYSLEAALKYFLLGAFATGFLLYGIALLYGVVGSASLTAIGDYFTKNSLSANPLSLIGLALLIVAFGFKVALVPFHMWTPDVYQGSPMPITAYMAVGAKAAGFAAILRVIAHSASFVSFEWVNVLWVLAALTMTVGNIIALVQDDIKRMLAYSSIAHAGYILVGIVASNSLTTSSVVFYLMVYLLMNMGAFAVAEQVSSKDERYTKIDNFRGLGFSQPILGLVMAVCMFSLAGFPPTAGFMGKFYLFSAAMQSGFVWLVVIAVINSLVSVYYYLRVVVAMYMYQPDEKKVAATILPGVGVVLLFAVVGVLYLGIFPGSFMSVLF